MSVQSLGGAYYFAVFKDNFTCYKIVHYLAQKSDIQASIQRVIPQIKREAGFPVQVLRSDRNGKYTSDETTIF
jgi:hypothetical protein